jgi:hypothetical protein
MSRYGGTALAPLFTTNARLLARARRAGRPESTGADQAH